MREGFPSFSAANFALVGLQNASKHKSFLVTKVFNPSTYHRVVRVVHQWDGFAYAIGTQAPGSGPSATVSGVIQCLYLSRSVDSDAVD